jgi:hypothetical protein
MKRITTAATMVVLLTVLGGLSAQAQNAPLGDYARQVRKQKGHQAPPVKSYDNDTIPRDDKLSVVGQAPAENQDANTQAASSEAAAEAAKAGAESSDAAGSAPAAEKHESAPQAASSQASSEEKKSSADEQAEKQKLFKDWQMKIQAQQTQVDEITKDLDLTNREYRLRAAAFYADAGNRLRNAGQWDKEDAQFKQQLADKQKKLDDAKQALEDLREQARKAGVPSSMRE